MIWDDCSSQIRILIFYPSQIPDPGVEKKPVPGSATLPPTLQFFSYYVNILLLLDIVMVLEIVVSSLVILFEEKLHFSHFSVLQVYTVILLLL